MLAPGQRGGVGGFRRGDILAIWRRRRIAVLDCVVTPPSAASYVWGVSQEAGSTTALAETCKRQTFECFRDGTGSELVPLAVEYFLNDLDNVVAADSCTSKAAFVRIVHQEPSCALCRGSARM